MHEASVAKDLLTLVEAAAGSRRVTRVGVEIGALSTIVPDSLQFAWEVIPKGTVAEGSALEISRVPLTIRCPICGFTGAPESIFAGCPGCGQVSVEVLTGRELRLTTLEVDDAPN